MDWQVILQSAGAGLIVGYVLGSSAGYFNGAIDAYYFARERFHPGGRRAGRIIYKYLRPLYPDVPNPDGE